MNHNFYRTECMVKEFGTLKSGQDQPKKQCQFPFKYDGKTFNGCIDFTVKKNGNHRPVKPWCSTKVNELTREHIRGKGYFGDCDNTPQCPNVGGFNEPVEEVIETPGKK